MTAKERTSAILPELAEIELVESLSDLFIIINLLSKLPLDYYIDVS
jgi:hypothetical protein